MTLNSKHKTDRKHRKASFPRNGYQIHTNDKPVIKMIMTAKK